MKKLVADSVLQSYQVLAMTSSTKDLDKKLDALSLLALDTEGKLVQLLSLRGSFKMFETSFDSFIGEWMENCNTNGRCEIHPSLSGFVNLTFPLVIQSIGDYLPKSSKSPLHF